MKLVAHRINTIKELQLVSRDCGIECDLRDFMDQIVLHHDPFVKLAESFDTFCEHYNHDLLILNIKSEGIEEHVLKILERHKISNFVFLDSSYPMIVKYVNIGVKQFAIRVSEYESIDTLRLMSGRVGHVWIDSFENSKINIELLQKIKNWGFKSILVSPELQGRSKELKGLYDSIQKIGHFPDYVCTKVENFELWKS